ncbi:MAG: PepSY-associated TM helix domain-containing protein [Bryobacteraceae bacterium]
MDEAHRGRPDKRHQLSLRRDSGEVVKFETFADFNAGRKVRSWLRWIHTGEAGGIAGQTLAGVASAGATLLVWTGLSLGWRRFRSWRSRAGTNNRVGVEALTNR